jgi:hypothetical protein
MEPDELQALVRMQVSHMEKANRERDAAQAERDAAQAERDAAQAERDAMKGSRSWRYTSPLRASMSSWRSRP